MTTEQPTSTPPGGGSWLWDAEAEAWVENPCAPVAPEPMPPNHEPLPE